MAKAEAQVVEQALAAIAEATQTKSSWDSTIQYDYREAYLEMLSNLSNLDLLNELYTHQSQPTPRRWELCATCAELENRLMQCGFLEKPF